MSRFRLRYLLQEFDVVGPELIIGRAPECHVTIDDPLISRQHAKVEIHDGVARVRDLGSRNGVRVNGRLVKEALVLTDGDRIRVGTQELIFGIARDGKLPRSTGYMKVCSACGTPYNETAASCPQCNAPALQDEDTLTGANAEPKRAWAFQLLSDVIERSLAIGRTVEAERLMQRAVREIEDRGGKGDSLDDENLQRVCGFAVRLAKLVGSATWLSWALDLYKKHRAMPSDGVMAELGRIDFQNNAELRSVWIGYARFLETLPGGQVKARSLSVYSG